MISIIGPVATAAGHVHKAADDVYDLPAGSYLKRQAADIPLHIGHDDGWTYGQVVDLDRSKAGLWPAVIADLDADMLDGDWFFSDRVESRSMGVLRRGEARMIELSLVRAPANLGLRPVRWGPGDITNGTIARPRNLSPVEHGVWDRVGERMNARSRYRSAPDLLIADADEPDIFDLLATDPTAGRAKLAQMTADARAARTRTAPAPKVRRPPDVGRVYRHAYPADWEMVD